MRNLDPKGEGALINVIFLVLLVGLGYAVYHFWFAGGQKGPTAGVSATPTVPHPSGGRKAGSMAGAAAQSAEALGEISGGN